MKRFLLAAAVAAISATACDEASAPQGEEGAITVHAYIDHDASGTRTAGDTPLSGIGIALSRDGADIATQTTGADGSTIFDGLRPGSYRIRATGSLPAGAMLVSNPEPSAVINFRGDPVDIGFQFAPLPASISGRVFRVADDVGAENVRVVLTRAGTTDTVAVTTTSATGAYRFDLLAAGEYQLEFEEAGAINYGAEGNTRTVTLIGGQASALNVNYTGSIHITVAQARAAAVNERVAVIADITVPAGRFTSSGDTRSEIWVQDATGGIAVFSVATVDSAMYRLGQRVEVVGLRGVFSGQEQISGTTASPLVVRQRTGGVVRAARSITAAVARTLADEGLLVRVEGLTVTAVGTASTSGAFTVTTVSATNDTLVVRVAGDDTGFVPASFTIGSKYDISGVLTQNGTTPQVKIRFPADLVPATAPVMGGIVINEIMANPDSVADSAGEYVELFNYGTTPIDLQNWIIADNFGVDTIKTSLVVPGGGYVLLGANADPALNGGIQVDFDFKSDIALANTADRFTLKDPTGTTIDSVAYVSGGVSVGASRGVMDPSADNSNVNGANWIVQTSVYNTRDKGTPRAQNDGYIAPAGSASAAGLAPAPATRSARLSCLAATAATTAPRDCPQIAESAPNSPTGSSPDR